MITPTISDETKLRIHALNRDKLSTREIARRMKNAGTTISHNTVARVLREGPPDGSSPRKAPEPAQEPPEPAKDLPPMPELPEGASVAAAMLWHQLRETRERRSRLPAGADHSAEYAALTRVELAQLKELERMIPAPTKDPAKDPHNIAARATFEAHVISTIEAVELRAGRLCPRCRAELLPPREDP
jgi:hypothetical protein